MDCIAKGIRFVSTVTKMSCTSSCPPISKQGATRTPQSLNGQPVLSSEDGWDFSATYEALREQYELAGTPIKVNFRKLAPFNSGVDRLTHLVHSYPAKVLLNIPLFFLHCEQIGSPGHLRDPFCGSGTVLLEGMIRGWKVSGADSNPLARLISRVKLTALDVEEISAAAGRVGEDWKKDWTPFLPVVEVDYWFSKEAQRKLGGLRAAIASEENSQVRDFLHVCLSSCVRKASFADPRLSVPVRAAEIVKQWDKEERYDVLELFETAVEENSRRVALLPDMEGREDSVVHISEDARNSTGMSLSKGCVDLVVTSPPYIGAQKYIRAASLNLGWLGLVPTGKLRDLEEQSIGREHYRKIEYENLVLPTHGAAHEQLREISERNPLRAHIASKYLLEMEDAVGEMARLVREGGKVILVVGNNTVAGAEFCTSQYIREMALVAGLRLELELVDNIRSRGLMTKRNKTAGIINREYIQVYTRP